MSSYEPDAESSDPRTLGQRMRALRMKLGVSQADLAGDTLSASAVSLLEADRRAPSPRTLAFLAARLGSTTEYLLYGTRSDSQDVVRLKVLHAEIALLAGDHAVAREGFDSVDDQRLGSYLRRRVRLGRAIALEMTGETALAIAELEDLRHGVDAAVAELSWLDVDAALSRCYRRAGRHAECLSLATEAVRLAESFGLQGIANHSELVINVIHELHEQDRVTEAVELAEAHLTGPLPPARLDPAVSYRIASIRAAAAGHTAEAMLMAERSLSVYGAVADVRAAAMTRAVAATVVLHNKPSAIAVATAALRAAHEVLLPLNFAADLAFCEVGLAGAAVRANDPHEAVSWAECALGRTDDVPPRNERVWALLVRCRGHHARGDHGGARTDADAAYDLLMALPMNRRSAVAWRELGDVLRVLGDEDRAWEAVDTAFSAVGVRRGWQGAW